MSESPPLSTLRAAAERGRASHYGPYSGYLVLAAVEAVDGRTFGGSNVEIVNFSLTKHAEEVAILAALSAGAMQLGRQWLRRLYVAGGAPCGSCRQFALEFGRPDSVCVHEAFDQTWLQANRVDSGTPPRTVEMRFDEMLPDAFLPDALESR